MAVGAMSRLVVKRDARRVRHGRDRAGDGKSRCTYTPRYCCTRALQAIRLRCLMLVLELVSKLGDFFVIEGFTDAVVLREPAAEVNHLAAGRAERSYGGSEKVDGSATGGAGDGISGTHVNACSLC